ncbi:nucleotidyltransferase family protein [Pulveribacter suum]|uniref:Nucleotidyltransferase family protein n=1 Tax=Pulveribacter suum TaxID=2116657 RepID=A0A2P1NK97_9BURK|nr:nucleotidyltransferase family protein [Pulveribacter suum]AVP57477.1 nucleotidyltransferase family protein [Pulveribacter suum]
MAADRTGGPWGAVVMAAGAGRRMGGVPKALLRREGEPLLLRQIRLLHECGVAHVAVALGHHAPRLAPVLAQAQAGRLPGSARLHWAVNPEPDAGPGGSLRCGLALLPQPLAGVLVVLGDQPLLQLQDVRAVMQAWQARGAGIELVVPVHAGQPGHPLALGQAVRTAVMQAPAGQGVREWRRAHAGQVQLLDCGHIRCTADVDTPGDVERLQREHGVQLHW